MLRFLCVGASQVEGYTQGHYGEMVMHPFSTRLKELLSQHCRGTVEVDNRGVSGEKVIDSMVDRLDRILSEEGKQYDWVLILGGANDLGTGAEADKLLAALSQMHDRARATGARTAALTIPQFALELMPGYETLKSRKAIVNQGLREYCEGSGSQSIFVDIYNELPHAALSPEERKRYWCDALHCTIQGYDRIAEIVFDALKKHLLHSDL